MPLVEPLVTIGMPVYNGEEYVEAAVRSLLSQTEERLRLVISDDSSTDRTPELCRRLASEDFRISFVQQSEKIGMTQNFRYVLENATTPYVMWAAQDDLWEETFIEETLDMLSETPDALGSMTAIQFVDGDGSLVKRYQFPIELTDNDPVQRAMSVQHGGFNAMYSMFRREMLPRHVKLEDVSGQDMALVYGLALHGRFVFSRRTLSIRRYLGYRDTVGPGGRLVWEKALGPASHIYSRRPHAMCRHMLSYSRAAPIRPLQKWRLYMHILRAWWWPRVLDLHRHDSRWRIKNAMEERRYLLGFCLVVQHVVLAPRTSLRGAVRRLSRLVRQVA